MLVVLLHEARERPRLHAIPNGRADPCTDPRITDRQRARVPCDLRLSEMLVPNRAVKATKVKPVLARLGEDPRLNFLVSRKSPPYPWKDVTQSLVEGADRTSSYGMTVSCIRAVAPVRLGNCNANTLGHNNANHRGPAGREGDGGNRASLLLCGAAAFT